MLALQISSMKTFMNQLLASDTFDIFLLEEAMVSTASTVTIDGHINRDFFTEEELASGIVPYDFALWSEIKPLCFHLIKGKHTPLNFKFVLLLKPEKANALFAKSTDSFDISQLKSLVLTIKYDGTKALLTTGTAYHTFVLTKEADQIWDRSIQTYLSKKGIEFEAL